MNKYLIGLGGMLSVLLVAGAGCAPQKPEAPQAPQAPQANQDVVEITMPAPDNAVTVPEVEVQAELITSDKPVAVVASEDAVMFAVSGINFAFAPTEMKVKKGQKVTINFNSDMGFHDLVIDELNVRTPQLKSPGTASVTFVADKIGTFEYYCSVGQHRVNGMVGKLVVE